jgi:hypothetical protein
MTTTRTRWLTVAGAGIAGLLAVVPAKARPAAPEGPALSGTVGDVDRARNEITLVESGEKLAVTAETSVVKDGAPATLAEVQEGDEVRASYSESGGAMRVSRIEVVKDPFTDRG